MYTYVGTHVELELKNPVGLLCVECSSGSLCEDCTATASNSEMNNWRSNLFLIVELLGIIGIGSWNSVFEFVCIYNWITPWISVLMD